MTALAGTLALRVLGNYGILRWREIQIKSYLRKKIKIVLSINLQIHTFYEFAK